VEQATVMIKTAMAEKKVKNLLEFVISNSPLEN
jgi:hypothetical protein